MDFGVEDVSHKEPLAGKVDRSIPRGFKKTPACTLTSVENFDFKSWETKRKTVNLIKHDRYFFSVLKNDANMPVTLDRDVTIAEVLSLEPQKRTQNKKTTSVNVILSVPDVDVVHQVSITPSFEKESLTASECSLQECPEFG